MPGNPWTTMRTVILDHQAETAVTSEASSRFDSLWDGIVWKLSRIPGMGVPRDIDNPNEDLLLGFPSKPELDLTINSIFVLYSYDQNNVTVHDILIIRET